MEARGFFERALAIDSESVTALVGMALVDVLMGAERLPDNRAELFVAAETKVIRALSLVPDNAVAHSILGTVQILTNRAASWRAAIPSRLIKFSSVKYARRSLKKRRATSGGR